MKCLVTKLLNVLYLGTSRGTAVILSQGTTRIQGRKRGS